MSRSFTNLLAHIIFSTKDREPLIVPDLKPELYAYLGGLTREWTGRKPFAWQLGHGAFNVSQSNVSAVFKYISDQETHHKKNSFKDESSEFLKKHNIQYGALRIDSPKSKGRVSGVVEETRD